MGEGPFPCGSRKRGENHPAIGSPVRFRSRRALFLLPRKRSLKVTRSRPFRQLRTCTLAVPPRPSYRSLSLVTIIIFIVASSSPLLRLLQNNSTLPMVLLEPGGHGTGLRPWIIVSSGSAMRKASSAFGKVAGKRASLSSPIHLPAMADGGDEDGAGGVLDGVDDSVVTGADGHGCGVGGIRVAGVPKRGSELGARSARSRMVGAAGQPKPPPRGGPGGHSGPLRGTGPAGPRTCAYRPNEGGGALPVPLPGG